ncbi:MAG: TlpA family protein disulfide reductase [Bacteroides sp.]|nr:TlpA family protein disulfide reductase [Bacteroides sp.]
MNSFRKLISTVCLCMAFMAGAQAPVVSFRISESPSDKPLSLAVRPVGNNDPNASVTMAAPDNQGLYTSPMIASPYDLYTVYVYNTEVPFQSQTTAYIPAARLDADAPVDLSIAKDGLIKVNLGDAANKDIAACTEAYTDFSRSIGEWSVKSDSAQLLSRLRAYEVVVDSVLKADPAPAIVEQYLRLSAYSGASDAYRMVMHLRQRAGLTTPVNSSDFLPAANTILDNDLAASFPSTPVNVGRSLRGTLPEKLTSLRELYSNKTIIDKVTDDLVSNYVTSYKPAEGLQPGLDMLADLQSRFGISPKWAEQLKRSVVTLPGALFPEDVTLIDVEGNPVPFSSFHGKWIYIDLWASWCGPCVQQIPYLKELEKTLADAPVNFVSISIDSSRDAWLKKVKDLELHGNQLLDASGNLARILNVSGIPHFLLYDPQGKLYRYKVTRPSQPETLELLKSLK